METEKLVLGIDFGTDSARAVVIDALTGEERSNHEAWYPRWREGLYCDASANQFRQHPLDHIEALTDAVRGALAKLPGEAARHVAGIGIDTTGSTVCAVNESGAPLALMDEFRDNPNAMFIMWKDHTAVTEAHEFNDAAKNWGGPDFTMYEGGVYSAEWFWAKILHVLRRDPGVATAAYSWVEHCDWVPAVLTGTEHPSVMKRSRCAAGHKAMWHEKWGGLPDEAFLVAVDPLLRGLRQRLYSETYTSDQKAGLLTEEWGSRLGLRPGIPVAVGAFDAHMGAVGGGVVEGALVKIMGTSTCDVMVARKESLGDRPVAGICGQVDGSVMPGMIGLEAGQSAYGDVYAWFRDVLSWPVRELLPETGLVDSDTAKRLRSELEGMILNRLSECAESLHRGASIVALDWLNGRRTPYADQRLKGGIVGLTLASSAPEVFRALVEATAFGAKAIVDRFSEEGLEIRQVIALGGVAKKNDFVMQIASDVLGMPIFVARSDQCCALGAAMFAAVAAGVYDTVPEAQAEMGCGFSKTFYPREAQVEAYRDLYRRYRTLGRILEEELRKL